MPKLKTHKGAAKRFRLTKNGKLMRMKVGGNHLRRRKKPSLKSDFRHAVSTENNAMIKLAKTLAGSAIQ